MGDHGRLPADAGFDAAVTPVPRRRILLLLGAGATAIAAGGGVGTMLEACAGPPIPVKLAVDPATLVPGTPLEVPFTLTNGSSTVAGSAWLLRRASGELIAYDPRCTHALCAYDWAPDAGRFKCHCHGGAFALDGSVLEGPPPRPLDRFPLRETAGTVEVDVPSGFATPRESAP